MKHDHSEQNAVFNSLHYVGSDFVSEDESLAWAKEAYRSGLRNLIRVSPVPTSDTLRVGEVLISKSGNARLIVSVERYGSDQLLTFVSRLRSGGVRVESAPRQKVDTDRLMALVARRAGNPLEKFRNILGDIRNESAILENVKTLLLDGSLGEAIHRRIFESRGTSGFFHSVELIVSPDTGQICSVGQISPENLPQMVKLQFNKIGAPSEEYIKNAVFIKGVSNTIKRNVVVASVIANTIENARNLMAVALMAGE